MHKRLPLSVASSLAIATLLTPSLAGALNIGDLELGIQPRFETGLMYYELERDAAAFNLKDTRGRSFNATESKLKFTDTLPVVLGGITFFVDRFFIDFSAQKAFNGSDSDTLSRSFTSLENVLSQKRETSLDADFDRTEYAISLGYAINEQIAVFAGYKRAKTEFDSITGSGTFEQRGPLEPGEPALRKGIIETDANFDFKYDGPFVGVTYGLNVSKDFLKGVLFFNFAAAFLNSKVESSVKSNLTFKPETKKEPIEFKTDFDIDGDTIGATFGINWRGIIKKGLAKQDDHLGYSININAYQYNFDADDSRKSDINETAVNFRVGIAYVF
jgi:hypothetical protein